MKMLGTTSPVLTARSGYLILGCYVQGVISVCGVVGGWVNNTFSQKKRTWQNPHCPESKQPENQRCRKTYK